MTNPHMLLAGDVGGTKTSLGLFVRHQPRPTAQAVAHYPTLDYDDFETLLTEFLDQHASGIDIEAAAFGVAGPIRGDRCTLTNVPWRIVAPRVAALLDLAAPRARLLNDLEAMACAIPAVPPDELTTLQRGTPDPDGHAALIAPGTGLGESMLHRVDGVYRPTAGEPGHTDFAARGDREIALLRHLIRRFGRASWEQVLSGPGLVELHAFTHTGAACESHPGGPARRPEAITAAAMSQTCPRCAEALDLFIGALGAEAGNLALRGLATAGVYIGGGIAPHILPVLRSETFVTAFRDKGPMTSLMAEFPVHVVRAKDVALLGAARVAATLGEP